MKSYDKNEDDTLSNIDTEETVYTMPVEAAARVHMTDSINDTNAMSAKRCNESNATDAISKDNIDETDFPILTENEEEIVKMHNRENAMPHFVHNVIERHINRETDNCDHDMKSGVECLMSMKLVPSKNSLPPTDQNHVLPSLSKNDSLCDKETIQIPHNTVEECHQMDSGAKKSCDISPKLNASYNQMQQQSVSPELLNYTENKSIDKEPRHLLNDTNEILQQFIDEERAAEHPIDSDIQLPNFNEANKHNKAEIHDNSSDNNQTMNSAVAGDSTQMSVEFSDLSTQTEQVDETNICPITKNKLDNKQAKESLIKPDHDLLVSETLSRDEKQKHSEAKIPEEVRKEMERLQHERRHYLDLLGLQYLPTSMTVELLEAKLNYCIGQTDLLLKNLEENVDAYSKPTHEQKTTMDFLAKYRADLKKSKEDIEECREKIHLRKGIDRSRSHVRRSDLKSQERQEQINAFKLERFREQQDYQKSHHATPTKGNTSLRRNMPLHGNSPLSTPRSVRSRSSSPLHHSMYMTPREHKIHLIHLRRQLINEVVEEEILHSRSCSPTFQLHSPQAFSTWRNPSKVSLGFSRKVSKSSSDKSDQTSPDRSISAECPRISSHYRCFSMERPRSTDEMLRSFSSSSSSRRSSSCTTEPGLFPRPQSDPRSPGHLDQFLSLNMDCLPDNETSQYSPYSAYAREFIIPNERSSPSGILRGTYELYSTPHGQSDFLSFMSVESGSLSDLGHYLSTSTLDEDMVKRLRPVSATDIKARIKRNKR